MLLLAHILIALASVGLATYTLFRPSESALKISYYSVGTTIASGTALVFVNSSHLAHVCAAGLIYTAITISLLAVAKRRLATVTSS